MVGVVMRGLAFLLVGRGVVAGCACYCRVSWLGGGGSYFWVGGMTIGCGVGGGGGCRDSYGCGSIEEEEGKSREDV